MSKPKQPDGPVLVVNAGSSSIKTALFGSSLRELLRIEATGIGDDEEGRITCAGESRDMALCDHSAALTEILSAMVAHGVAVGDLSAAAHRVVHGGPDLSRSLRITPQVRGKIAACIPLAPLHNPHNLAAIDAITAAMPDLPQCASFDTAFHATNPPVAYRYALPDTPETAGLRRYGFHGISYGAMVQNWEEVTGAPLPNRLLAMHLGNGASLCAIHKGRSVATTMGFSPLGGLTMGTRVGEIDAGAVLHLARQTGIDAAEDLLQKRAGLLGLSGISADMRRVQAAATPAATFARNHVCYWITRQAGSMISAMGGLDGIAFTGGIGENDTAMRKEVLANLLWTGNVPSWVIPAAEERHIAEQALIALKEAPQP